MTRVTVMLPASTVAHLDKTAELNSGRGWTRSDAIREALADRQEQIEQAGKRLAAEGIA